MTDHPFSQAIDAERTRLQGELATIEGQMNELSRQAADYMRGLNALNAYEAALRGKAPTASGRASRGSLQGTLLALIAGGSGMTRAGILEELGVKGNRSQEGSISNALSTMTKSGKLHLKDGTYTAA